MQKTHINTNISRSNNPSIPPPFSTILNAETANFSYLVCANCERALANTPPTCAACRNKFPSPAAPKRLYRLLLTVAISDKAVPAICFDRAARVLVGCSADELFDFCASNPSAAETMGEMLEGEMCGMVFGEPKNGNAQHLRVVSVAPLRAGFRPVFQRLCFRYGGGGGYRRSLN